MNPSREIPATAEGALDRFEFPHLFTNSSAPHSFDSSKTIFGHVKIDSKPNEVGVINTLKGGVGGKTYLTHFLYASLWISLTKVQLAGS